MKREADALRMTTRELVDEIASAPDPTDPGCCVDKKRGDPGACTEATCMRLPKASTCGDCAHVLRCTTLFGAKPGNTTCDFFPRRFLTVTG